MKKFYIKQNNVKKIELLLEKTKNRGKLTQAVRE